MSRGLYGHEGEAHSVHSEEIYAHRDTLSLRWAWLVHHYQVVVLSVVHRGNQPFSLYTSGQSYYVYHDGIFAPHMYRLDAMVQVKKEGCSASFRGYCGRNFFTNSNACYRRTASICLTIFIPLRHCDHYSFVLRPPLPAPITLRRPVRSMLFHFISILSAIFSRTREVCGNLQVQYYLETCLLMKNVTFHHCLFCFHDRRQPIS